MNERLKKIAVALGMALTLSVAANSAAYAGVIPLIDTSTPGEYTASLSETGVFSGAYDFHLGSGNGLLGLTTSDAPLSSFIAWLTGGSIVGTLAPSYFDLSTDPDYDFSTVNLAFAGLTAGDYTLHISAQGAAGAQFTTLVATSVSAVPEPETLALMLAGLGVMSAVARRRSAAKAA